MMLTLPQGQADGRTATALKFLAQWTFTRWALFAQPVLSCQTGASQRKLNTAQLWSKRRNASGKRLVSQVYNHETVTAIPETTEGDWSRGETMTDMRTVGQDNPFRVGDSQVGVIYQVAGLRQEQEIIGLNSDRVFEENGAITDLSYYTERTTSNESSPEHSIVYVSETITSEPEYDELTTCGLAMRSGCEFSRVDQLRTWLYSGMEVRRFHPSESGTIGPSNMLPDLVYHLMTDSTAGIGDLVSEELLDLDSFADASNS